jgi:hypothetical protein
VTGAIREASPSTGSETALLLACARNRTDSKTLETIQSIVADGAIDWTLLVRRALAQRVTPLLAQNLTRNCPHALPSELAAALRDSLIANRERNLALAQEVVSTVELLATRNIPVIPIKGPVLAATLYHDVGLRQSGDLDFLVHPEDVSNALGLLIGRGYELIQSLSPSQDAAYRRYYPDFSLFNAAKSVLLELHWNPVPYVMAVPYDLEALWRRAGPIEFEGHRVLSLSQEDYLIYLCVHAAKHLWGQLNWVCDTHEFLAVHAGIDWDRCFHYAKNLGCERILRVGLVLAHDLLETCLPEQVTAYIGQDPQSARIAARIQARLLAEEDRPPNIFEAFWPFLPLREHFRDRLRYRWRNFTTPRVNHFGIVQLPRALWFLYVPIKLLYDYVWRPLTFFKARPG